MIASIPVPRTAHIVAIDAPWRTALASMLEECGWSVSAGDELPISLDNVGVLILRKNSLSASLELADRAAMSRGRDGSAVLVFDFDPEDKSTGADRGEITGHPATPSNLFERLSRAPLAGMAQSNILVAGPFKLDLGAGRMWIKGRELALTATEFNVLALLVRRANEPVSQDELRKVLMRSRAQAETSRVRTQISNLRRKLASYGALLETVIPRRYRLRIRRRGERSFARNKKVSGSGNRKKRNDFKGK